MLQFYFYLGVATSLLLSTLTMSAAPVLSDDKGKKTDMTIEKKDGELKIGGKTRIEHFYQDNEAMLNKNIPDENEYIKHTLDISFDYAFGKKQFGYKAIQMFTNIRHKSIWGKGLSYADKESGPNSPAQIEIDEVFFGAHSHSSGKPLLWMTESWIQCSLNAFFNNINQHPHSLKAGWFPFRLGRGIALGSAYGLNKEILGLYSYAEDKSAPGISLSGPIIHDWLDYEIYYSKFEERNKSFSDTISPVHRHWIGRELTPWRGTGKDDHLVAARLKAYPLPRSWGNLEIEPYWFYNKADDQVIEIAPDVDTILQSVGCAAEYSYKKTFECGLDCAFNLGEEKLAAIDRNLARPANRDGQLVLEYSHITKQESSGSPSAALVDTTTKKLAQDASKKINSLDLGMGYSNRANRIRPCYTNKLRGWMAVADMAYSIPQWNLSMALAYGIVTGDKNPHVEEKDKTYREFIGLHEFYIGKRVKSFFLLDQRALKRPTALIDGATKAETDLRFSDLEHVGAALNWKPTLGGKQLTINPNLLFFWKEFQTNKFNQATNKISSSEPADRFMGTELSIACTATVMPDLVIHAVAAAFFPGQYFKDVAGVELSSDFINKIQRQNPTSSIDLSKFRINADSCYHLNVGFSYSF